MSTGGAAHAHPRGRLADRLRPDLPRSTARQRVDSVLWLVRRALHDPPLDADGEAVHVPRVTRTVDVEAFRALAALGRLCGHEPENEEPLRLLLRTAEAAVRPSVGLEAFERHRRRLGDLGLESEAATLEEVERLRGPFAPAGGQPGGGRPARRAGAERAVDVPLAGRGGG